ncbi:MAG: hypothetical protein J4O03_17000 [Chloroflexi bacterium]|nr:hypothetical protein [Chloroflexota bacterium]MCI0787934.1 hypothetical protein [Chloroflexota bacterium]MCI0795163.1 hypothetical protein [Chloroflexota bacterium]MCI0800100.1 hypothetical protein [Chloroflexota bacterium]
MQLENKCLVPADRDTTWELVMDIPRVAACIPGVNDVTPVGDDKFNAVMQVRIGPMRLSFSGTILIVDQDKQKGEARFRVEAADRRLGGSFRADMILRLNPLSETQTELSIESDVAFMGKLGELGQPLIRRKAGNTLEDFARNLSQQVNSPPS